MESYYLSQLHFWLDTLTLCIISELSQARTLRVNCFLCLLFTRRFFIFSVSYVPAQNPSQSTETEEDFSKVTAHTGFVCNIGTFGALWIAYVCRCVCVSVCAATLFITAQSSTPVGLCFIHLLESFCLSLVLS